MKTRFKQVVLAVVVAFVPTIAQSAEHSHESGPHGGLVTGFGDKNHLEAVRKGDKIDFYVLGDDGKSPDKVSKHEGGTVTIITPGNQEKTDIPAGNDFSEMTVNAKAKGKLTVLVKLKVKSKIDSAKFNLK